MAVLEDLQLPEDVQQALDGSTDPASAPVAASPEFASTVLYQQPRSIVRRIALPLVSLALAFLFVWPVVHLMSQADDVDVAELTVEELLIPLPEEPIRVTPANAAPEDEPEALPAVVAAPTGDAAAADPSQLPIPGQSAPAPAAAATPVAPQPTFDATETNLNVRFGLPPFGFEPGSDEPTTEAKVGLLEVSQYLRDNPQPVIVAAYTDSLGSAEGNLALSQQRAELVRDRMVALGVDVGMLTAVGYGEANPIASNDTEEGRDANRRIEFIVVQLPFAD